jgi:hypothetical protein
MNGVSETLERLDLKPLRKWLQRPAADQDHRRDADATAQNV